jgi:hypothetical protein
VARVNFVLESIILSDIINCEFYTIVKYNFVNLYLIVVKIKGGLS